MNESRLFDSGTWEKLVSTFDEFKDDLDSCQLLVDRLLGQYLPALLSARTEADLDRVWRAFWSYLTAPATRLKPFGLSSESADELIGKLQAELARLGHMAQE